ncbi:EF-hand domain pair domain-containing protein [Ditylenchus destructor]|nr:EF-hand domain pair domain-containing protein [Ditylenchus destructor]
MKRSVPYILIILSLLRYSQIYGGIPPEIRRVDNDAQLKEPNQLAQPAPNTEKKNIHRPSHLEAVPLERDGSLNKEFRREVLLGEDTNNLKDGDSKQNNANIALDKIDPEDDKAQLDALLRQMFKKADTNVDGKLNEEELKQQIIANTNHHLDEAKEESNNIFQTIDENGDGKITWNEYKTHFIVEKGLVDQEHAKDHADKKHPDAFDRESRLMIQEEETAFQAADADGDGLDDVEWLSFRHPEHSKVMLREMTEEIMKAFDKNNNGVLTQEEFSAVHGGDVTDPKMEKEYVAARRHEFETMIDKDKDGKATLEELLAFVDPRNERHAAEEVSEIMAMADSDGDGFLTLDELLAKSELLSSSGFIHPKARLHDDL